MVLVKFPFPNDRDLDAELIADMVGSTCNQIQKKFPDCICLSIPKDFDIEFKKY